MAKSFAQDGAVGAGGPGESTAPIPGAKASAAPSIGSRPPTAQELTTSFGPGAPAPTVINNDGPAIPAPAGVNNNYSVVGTFFSQGGGVPDSDGAGDNTAAQPQSDPMSATLQQALGAVDKTLQYTYQQFGLTTGAPADGSGGGIQEASNMPAVPGNQSESGIKPQQPMPGPLPPTKNPFGKRAGIDTGDNEQENA